MSFQYAQPQPEEKKPPVRRGMLIAVVVGLGVVICLVIGGVLIIPQLLTFVVSAAAEPASDEPVSYDIPTAREAYTPAVTLIRQQDPGAQLASATGAWTPVINRAQLKNGRTGWTFAFYLPATSQMALVIVDRVTGPRIASVEAWDTRPDLLDDQNWQIDSGIGMSSFMATCSGAFVAQPDGQVQATLTTITENQRLLWQYQLLLPDGTVPCQVNVDASSGQLWQ